MTLTEQLQEAIRSHKGTPYEVCKATGVPSPTMSRFLSGKRSITLPTAEKLAAFFGMRFTRPQRPKREG